jgi:hypothetical protein
MLDGLESLSSEATRPCARRLARLDSPATNQPRSCIAASAFASSLGAKLPRHEPRPFALHKTWSPLCSVAGLQRRSAVWALGGH